MSFRIKTTLQAALVCSALAGGSALHAANMSNDDYKAAKDRIEAEYKAQKDSCDKLKDNAKDVCREEAKGKEKVGPRRARVQSHRRPEGLGEAGDGEGRCGLRGRQGALRRPVGQRQGRLREGGQGQPHEGDRRREGEQEGR